MKNKFIIKRIKNETLVKHTLRFFLMINLFFSTAAFADPISDIINMLGTIEGYQKNMAGYENDIDGYESAIKNYQSDIASLTGKVQGDMTGSYGWGTNGFQDFQSWGSDATNWNSVISVAQNGGSGSSSELGQMMQTIQNSPNQVVFNPNAFQQTDSNTNDENYYAMQAQTTIAARAASQVDFNNIQNQINYENGLRQDIENTTNLKAAVDLQNRLTAENNLIQLEILRQVALMNQQKSVSAQADINNATQNAAFLQPVN